MENVKLYTVLASFQCFTEEFPPRTLTTNKIILNQCGQLLPSQFNLDMDLGLSDQIRIYFPPFWEAIE